LKHPNIVDFEEAFSDKSNIIIIMEYCEGNILINNLEGDL
jgi:serine/threonine protein kinase